MGLSQRNGQNRLSIRVRAPRALSSAWPALGMTRGHQGPLSGPGTQGLVCIKGLNVKTTKSLKINPLS